MERILDLIPGSKKARPVVSCCTCTRQVKGVGLLHYGMHVCSYFNLVLCILQVILLQFLASGQTFCPRLHSQAVLQLTARQNIELKAQICSMQVSFKIVRQTD